MRTAGPTVDIVAVARLLRQQQLLGTTFEQLNDRNEGAMQTMNSVRLTLRLVSSCPRLYSPVPS